MDQYSGCADARKVLSGCATPCLTSRSLIARSGLNGDTGRPHTTGTFCITDRESNCRGRGRNLSPNCRETLYQSWLQRMLGPQQFILTMEWYYAWQGCSVSPHCDARRKLATHIFYFNTEEDWEENWGGQILMMDDEGRYKPHSAPAFDDLKVAASLVPRGNESLFFQRTEHSWHGVRPLGMPIEQAAKALYRDRQRAHLPGLVAACSRERS